MNLDKLPYNRPMKTADIMSVMIDRFELSLIVPEIFDYNQKLRDVFCTRLMSVCERSSCDEDLKIAINDFLEIFDFDVHNFQKRLEGDGFESTDRYKQKFLADVAYQYFEEQYSFSIIKKCWDVLDIPFEGSEYKVEALDIYSVDDFLDLQELVYKNLESKDHYLKGSSGFPVDKLFLLKMYSNYQGEIFGIRKDDKLVSAMVCHQSSLDENSLALQYSDKVDDLKKSVQMRAGLVHPDFMGIGLSKKLIHGGLCFLQDQAFFMEKVSPKVLTTVHSGNVPSNKAVNGVGFSEIGIRDDWGGFMADLLGKEPVRFTPGSFKVYFYGASFDDSELYEHLMNRLESS